MSDKSKIELKKEYDGLDSRATIKEFIYALDDFSEKADPKKPDDHRSYVYALCEKVGDSLVPFYIGEGKGPRVWSHELETSVQIKLLEEEFSSEGGKEDLEERKKELKKKIQKIDEIKSHNGEVVKYIIKWGMTSKEAFMAESALINLLQIGGLKFDSSSIDNRNELTNIVKGHRSEGEKQTGTTEARTVEEFCELYAKDPLYFEDLQEKKVKAILININSGYPECMEYVDKEKREIAIRDTACGNWSLRSIDGLEKLGIEYVFATVQARIVGVFKIKEVGGKKFHYFYESAYDNSEYPHGDDTVSFRNGDYEYARKILKAAERKRIHPSQLVLDDLPTKDKMDFISKVEKDDKKKNPAEAFISHLEKRKYMILESISEDDPNYSEYSQYLYRTVIHTDEYVEKTKAERKKKREKAIQKGKTKDLPNPDTVTNNIYGSGNPIKYIEG